MDRMVRLITDHAYHWRGYGDYCGRCLRNRHAPRWDLTPLISQTGVQCRACGKQLRASPTSDHKTGVRI